MKPVSRSSVVVRVMFGGGWVALSLLGLVGALRGTKGVTGPWPVWALFAAGGVWMVVSVFRELRSPESRAQRMGVGPLAVGRPVAPAMAYRAPAATARPSAREAYAPALATLPLRLLPTRPGTDLAYALRIDTKDTWFILAFAIFWNALTLPIAIGLLVAFVQSGDPISIGVVAAVGFIGLFVAVGIFIATMFLRRFLGQRKLARVEVDAEPAYAGDELALNVAQPGPATINRITATLRCEERASYTVGTDTRTEKHVVHEMPLFDEGMLQISRGEPWSRRVRISLPEGPFSFKSPNNEIVWSVVLKADIASWPDYEESFDLRVLPRVTEGARS